MRISLVLVRASVLGLSLALFPAVATADWLYVPFVGATFGGSTVLLDLEQGASSTQLIFGGSAGWWSSGIIGLETALPLTMTLVAAGVLSLSEAVRKLTVNPAQVFALPYGTLTVGAPADVAIFDPAHSWLVDVTRLRSKSKNSPFDKWELKGKVVVTMVGGRIVHDERTIGC